MVPMFRDIAVVHILSLLLHSLAYQLACPCTRNGTRHGTFSQAAPNAVNDRLRVGVFKLTLRTFWDMRHLLRFLASNAATSPVLRPVRRARYMFRNLVHSAVSRFRALYFRDYPKEHRIGFPKQYLITCFRKQNLTESIAGPWSDIQLFFSAVTDWWPFELVLRDYGEILALSRLSGRDSGLYACVDRLHYYKRMYYGIDPRPEDCSSSDPESGVLEVMKSCCSDTWFLLAVDALLALHREYKIWWIVCQADETFPMLAYP